MGKLVSPGFISGNGDPCAILGGTLTFCFRSCSKESSKQILLGSCVVGIFLFTLGGAGMGLGFTSTLGSAVELVLIELEFLMLCTIFEILSGVNALPLVG